jgi:hypothetical protein
VKRNSGYKRPFFAKVNTNLTSLGTSFFNITFSDGFGLIASEQESKLRSGRPDWENFRLLSECLLCAFFGKNVEEVA